MTLINKYLNELCMDVCEELVKEKRNRTVADWYSKLVKFENSLSTSHCTVASISMAPAHSDTSVVLNSSGYFDTSSPYGSNSSCASTLNSADATELALVDQTLETMVASSTTSTLTSLNHHRGGAVTHPDINLGHCMSSSGMSSSQSSLNSCSSSNFSISPSSSSSSSAYTTFESSSSTRSASGFSLEVYLSALTKTKAQLSDEYEKKATECAQLKQNIGSIATFIESQNVFVNVIP